MKISFLVNKEEIYLGLSYKMKDSSYKNIYVTYNLTKQTAQLPLLKAFLIQHLGNCSESM